MLKVTEIEPQKRNKNRYNIYINENFAFGLDEEIVAKYDVCVNKELTQEFLTDVLFAEEKSKAMDSALNYLSYTAKSEKEIRKKLSEKEYEEDIIDYVIEKLKGFGYIDDIALGHALIKDRQIFKKVGKRVIAQDLFHKGIPKETVDELMQETYDEDEEFQRALTLAQKKLSTLEGDRYKIKGKLYAFLSRKGYVSNIISQVMNELEI